MTDPSAAAPARRSVSPSRHRGRIRKTLLIALAASVAVVACGAALTSLARPAGPPATGTGSAGGTATIGVILEPTSLDITSNQGIATSQILIDNVYQGLVGIKPGTVAELVPVLATELPEMSPDGRTATFTLRTGVRFHSGARLTSHDVVVSLRETMRPETVGFASEIIEVDDSTIRIELAEPNSGLLWQLANAPGQIRKAGAENDLTVSANGTGPYTLDTWERGKRLTLVRNAAYWGEPATLDSAVFQFVPRGRAAVTALRSGELDVHTALLPSLSPEFENDPEFTSVAATSTDVFTLAFNSQKAPFNDVRVRTALSRAIDEDALIAAQNNSGTPLGGPITELDPGYADLTQTNAYDPASARELLREAGQENLSLTITMPDHYDPAPIDHVKRQFAAVGVAVTVKEVPFATWLEQVATNHDYQVSYVDHAEARNFGIYANPDSYFGYDNETVQGLYASAVATTDPTAADHLLRAAAAQVATDAPAKWLFNYTPTNVVSANVTGFPTVNTNSRINLAGVRVK
ncbi:peptide/nickel transport system substrate-binding protein [Leucobacter luti]|uniref:Peptide/nickel transport system substrate-binding protein n=1 Tax=Leucobacter luti TaxID=340320 RepID=A0A4R6S764_9MICO|nr:ABC transporter substrate-binding protein [Leucobacter luti]TDP94635.1 peptide/nickel transport system substrate-binding protein [Leucobacter luti]